VPALALLQELDQALESLTANSLRHHFSPRLVSLSLGSPHLFFIASFALCLSLSAACTPFQLFGIVRGLHRIALPGKRMHTTVDPRAATDGTQARAVEMRTKQKPHQRPVIS
jgi:hypothetical protein